MLSAQKSSNLGPVLNKPLLLKCVTEAAQLLGDFCNSAAKIASLMPFQSSSYVYGVFGAQRSRDCTVTVLVSQIKRGHVTALSQ